MYLLVADETNKNAGGAASFLIYGGLIVDVEKLPSLNSEIEAIRVEAGYKPGDEFKFDTRARPSHVTQKAATDAKRKVIAACAKQEAVVIVQVSSHELIKNQSEEQRLTFAANTIFAAYNKFLTEKGAHGICVLDNLPIKRPAAFLAEKFTRGLIFPDGKTRRLDRIALLATSNLNAGHILTAVDIVLGTFRFCVNKPRADGPASTMLASLVPLLHHKMVKGQRRITEHGLLFRPKRIQTDVHEDDYRDLRAHLNALVAGNGTG